MKLDKLGWIVATGLAGIMAISGFQGQSMKLASCDVEKVFAGSQLFKTNSDSLEQYQLSRTNVLRFLVQNREMANADAKSFATLSLQKNQSDADRAKLEKIKNDASTQVDKHRALLQKKDPSADDQAALTTIQSSVQANSAFAQELDQQYSAEVAAERTRLQTEALEKVRKTIREIAEKKDYNIVFSVDAAPFAANNITDEALKEVNKS